MPQIQAIVSAAFDIFFRDGLMETITIEKALAIDESVIFAPTGSSMLPFIKQGRDLIVLRKKKPNESIKPFQIVLYQRYDGSIVLHRVLIAKKTKCWIVGDNSVQGEYVENSRILGILSEIRRKNRQVHFNRPLYSFTVLLWYVLFPCRYVAKKMSNYSKKIYHLYSGGRY